MLYFYVVLFAFSFVMLLRSLIHQRWNDIAIYLVLLAFSFISISMEVTFTNIVAMVNEFEAVFGGP